MLKLRFWHIDKIKIIFILVLIIGYFFIELYREIQIISSTEVNSWTEELSADCAIVLTGGPQRVREGFDLLVNQRVKKLIISGVHPKAQLREIMPNILFYGGLREKDISLERKSGSTYGNAQQSLPIAEALECRDVLLVTSRYHMHRAYNTFRSIFPDHIIIYKNSVYGNLNNNKFIEILVEALKTRFYKLWVF